MTTTRRLIHAMAAAAVPAWFGLLGAGAIGTPVAADGVATGAPPAPVELRGAAAARLLAAFGIDDAVAHGAGTTTDELLDELRADPLLFVGRGGVVGVTEPAIEPAELGAAESQLAALASDVPSDVYALHSRESSSRVVYLDIDGHVSVGGHWNAAYGLPSITSAPYDIDGDPSALSAEERARVVAIWQQVAEDYAPFDVDVTTADPGLDGLRRTWVGDPAYGIRVVVTSSDWYGQRTGRPLGGIALVNVFGAATDQSAFVFAGNLGGSAKNVGEAASHEAGHTFGLFHDGSSTSAYDAGHGDWAPIMGVGYSKPITQWSRGEYAAADNDQDDIAVIAEHARLATDDRPGAAPPEPVGSSSTTSGLLGFGDRDTFTVTVGAGPLHVTLSPGAPSTNLHATLVVSGDEGVIGRAAPTTAIGWSAEVAEVVPAGTYTIELTTTGWRSAIDGFTAYASAGAYRLEVAGVAPVAVGPAADPTPPALLEPIAPVRLVDTRSGLGDATRAAAGTRFAVQVTGRGGVPATATAAVLTVTVVDPDASGFVTVHPCSSDPTGTSTVNYAAGQIIANTTIATLDAGGGVCVFTSATADVVVDMTGWLGPTGSAKYRPAGPRRVADTRLGGGARLAAAGTLTVQLGDLVPPGTTAVAVNVTAVDGATAGFLTASPCGGVQPRTSTVNYARSEARANNTVVGLSDGALCISSSADVDVVVDLVGTFGPSGLSYRPAEPTRVVDTRRSGGGPARTPLPYAVGNAATAITAPVAASVNITAVNSAGAGYVTTFDCGEMPVASTLNQRPAAVDANGAIVPVGEHGQTCLWALMEGDLVVDVVGWWVA